MSQVVTNIPWGTRIRNAFLGIIFGIILIFGSIYFIFSNEKSGVITSTSLKQTANAVVEINPAPIDANNNKKVVAFHGQATTKEVLNDSFLNLSINAIRLSRYVEMYQWQEKSDTQTQDNMGGSETKTTTYTYEMAWFPSLINSDRFHDSGHNNPTTMPLSSAVAQAQNVTVGDFTLSKQLIDQIDEATNVDLSTININVIQDKFNCPVILDGDYLYVGKDPKNPVVGDLRINVKQVLPQEVSIIAQQNGNTLEAYVPPAGQSVALLVPGNQSPQDMIKAAENKNNTHTWIIRLATLVALVIGFLLIFQPIVVLADVVPIFGKLVGAGMFIFAFTLGASVWIAFTAIAWFFVRPMMSILLLVIAIIVGFGIYKFRRRKISPTVNS